MRKIEVKKNNSDYNRNLVVSGISQGWRTSITRTLQLLVAAILSILLYHHFVPEELSSVDQQLMDAVAIGDLQAAQTAIEKGAAVNRQDWIGSTPLHTAAWRGDLAMARLLIQAGARIDVIDFRSGETPLHSAARGVEPAMIKFLLETGADPNARIHSDSEQCNGTIYPAGATALDIARINGLTQLVHNLKVKSSTAGDPELLNL